MTLRAPTSLCCALLLVACSATPQPREAKPGQPTLSVVSYNVIMLLQESSAEWEPHLRRRFAASHPHIAFRQGSNG